MNAPRPGTFRMLDAYRGVASLAVVAFHWSEMAISHQAAWAGNPLYALSAYGFLGVQIFFVISGYCIANAAVANLRRGDSLKNYVMARLRRIYPTYWAALILAAAFFQISYEMAQRGMIPHNLFTQTSLWARSPLYHLSNVTLTMVPLNQPPLLAVAWTLCYELAFYGIVGVALFFCAGRAGRLLTLLHGFTLLTLGALLLVPNHNIFPLELWPHFGMGIFVYDLIAVRDNAARTKAVGIGFASALALYAAFVGLYDVHIGFFGQTSRVTFAAAGAFALFLLATYRFDAKWAAQTALKWLGAVGVFSYSLYLTHTIALRVFNQLWRQLHLSDGLHLVGFALAVATSVLFAYGFYLLFERPLLNRGRKSAQKKGAAA